MGHDDVVVSARGASGPPQCKQRHIRISGTAASAFFPRPLIARPTTSAHRRLFPFLHSCVASCVGAAARTSQQPSSGFFRPSQARPSACADRRHPFLWVRVPPPGLLLSRCIGSLFFVKFFLLFFLKKRLAGGPDSRPSPPLTGFSFFLSLCFHFVPLLLPGVLGVPKKGSRTSTASFLVVSSSWQTHPIRRVGPCRARAPRPSPLPLPVKWAAVEPSTLDHYRAPV
nr:hypothetical protein [Pandoravirus massiliensis]